ncbi:MAG: helix-turn-helix transcriptional regulator [Bryobacteraceae bacterium]
MPAKAQTLGDHLRIIRVDRNLTQAQVAQQLLVAYQTVHKWEANLTVIAYANRAKIIRFLGYDPSRKSRQSNRQPK